MFDPVSLGNSIFVVNGPSYRVKGVELQFVARVTEADRAGIGSWNSSSQTNAPCLTATGPRLKPDPDRRLHHADQQAALHNPFGVWVPRQRLRRHGSSTSGPVTT